MKRRFLVVLLSLPTLLAILAVWGLGRAGQAGTSLPATSWTVSNTADSGPNTLRQALLDAESGDTIVFDPAVFPLSNPAAIALLSPLPDIAQGALTIDGSIAGVILDGSALASGNGFHITSNNNVIKGLQILHFPHDGVLINDGASNNQIGGSNGGADATCDDDCNVISGNGGRGVGIGGPGTDNNIVQGNYIGIDASGTTILGNSWQGVQVFQGAQGNQIGGNSPGEGNVISGNGGNGVMLNDPNTMSNIVSGNYVGTDTSSTLALPNGNDGILIASGASQNTIGPNNAIAYNLWCGPHIDGSATTGNTIKKNSIFDNLNDGICLTNGGNGSLPKPQLVGVDWIDYVVTGTACENCTIEIFADDDGEGKFFEGQTVADNNGDFSFEPGSEFTGPCLTATATDATLGDGSTSAFSTQACSPHYAFLPIVTSSSWTLAWSDEFDGAANTSPTPRNWTCEVGGWGWGNNELQYYTAGQENVHLDGNGNLVITAREIPPDTYSCWYGSCQYTSARCITKDKVDFAYGRIEARIKIPFGQGIWSAFWMLGADLDQAGWPACGEIDIMENIGSEPSTVHGTVHGPGYSGAEGIGCLYTLPGGGSFSDAFHIFAVEWEPGRIHWFVDEQPFWTVTPQDLPSGTDWVFDHDFFILLNVAVGGNWQGSPDQTTTFPQTMHIDWVRVYHNTQ